MTYLLGGRIRLRAAERSDIPLFVKWINDPEVTENVMLQVPMSVAEEERWFDSMLEQPQAQHVYVIGVKLPSTGKEDVDGWQSIGTIQFHDISWLLRKAEIGIMIGEKDFWDKGYGTEAMLVMLKHGFETLNLHRIWLQVFDKNKRGIRAYEKAGFVQEGRFRDGHYQHGRYYDIIIMSILKTDWELRINA
jgi:diamine N-acetyltransferase